MAQNKDSQLKPLIDEVITALMDELTDGLTAEQVEWSLSVMRSTILPYELRFAADDTDEGKAARTQLIIGDLKQELAGHSARERYRTIQRRFYISRLLPLSDEAFDLALRRMNGEATGAQMSGEVQALRDRLNKLIARMKEKAPQVHEALAGVISETSVDLAYAAGEVDVMSLRVGRVHSRSQSGVATCPKCATANPAGSRFCNRCGADLPG